MHEGLVSWSLPFGVLRAVVLAPAALQLHPLLGDDLVGHEILGQAVPARLQDVPHVVASARVVLVKAVGEHLLGVHPLAYHVVELDIVPERLDVDEQPLLGRNRPSLLK